MRRKEDAVTMPDTMPEQARIRLTFDVPDRVRRALNIAASERNETVGEVIESLTEELLSEQLSRADEVIAKAAKASRKKSAD